MDIEKISDLAFKFVENDETDLLAFFVKEGGIVKDCEYFAVFVKHWMLNKLELKFSSMYLDMGYEISKRRVISSGKEIKPSFY